MSRKAPRGRLGRSLARGAAIWLAVASLPACSNDPPVESDGYVLLNNGWPDQLDVSLVAGERVLDPERTVSFGTGTIENVGDRPVVIVDVTPLDTFGDIELVGVIVNGTDRDALWIAADERFPPSVGLGTTAPARGFVIEPGDTGGTHSGVNLVQGYHVRSEVAGVRGFCVTYRVDAVDSIDEPRRRCWPNHWLLACEDVDDAACVVPAD